MIDRDIMCINSLVDGLTECKIYKVIHVELKQDGVYYGIHDDYDVYNLYKKNRFITVTDGLLKSIHEYSKHKTK